MGVFRDQWQDNSSNFEVRYQTSVNGTFRDQKHMITDKVKILMTAMTTTGIIISTTQWFIMTMISGVIITFQILMYIEQVQCLFV